MKNKHQSLQSNHFFKENFGNSNKNFHKPFCTICFKNCSIKQAFSKFQTKQADLAKFKDYLKLKFENSNKPVDKIDKLFFRILNVFEISNDLIKLASLCEIQVTIDEIALILDEVEINLRKNFSESKIIQMVIFWKHKLSQFNKKQRIDQRLAIDLEFEIILWLTEIESITQTNLKIFLEISTDYPNLELIQKGLDLLSKNINEIEIQYSMRILRYLIIIQKKSGLTIYPEKFGSDIELDPFLMGGFLSAISDFGSELFKRETNMNTLSYEDLEIKIQDGNQIRVALILQGKGTKYISDGLSEFIKEFEENYSSELMNWTGALEPFIPASKILEKIFPNVKIYHNIKDELRSPLILA